MKQYTDIHNYIHFTYKEIGRGGQGIVYRTKDADTAIKIALNNEKSLNENQRKIFQTKIQNLILKPITKDMNIAKPLSLIKNEAGYVMNLLSEMFSLSKIMPSFAEKEEIEMCSVDKIPHFLQPLFKKDKRSAFFITKYLETGGLRKRLYILSALGVELLKIHSKGLVYCDLSHENVFINNDDNLVVFLIDADNIEYAQEVKGRTWTPGYEVPEIVNENTAIPNSAYSDIYAYAILAFRILTMTHPFEGEGVGWDKNGLELPWINDSNDDSNRSKKGLQGTLTITHELDQLFHTVFEQGKNDRYKRPTLPIWIKAFEKAVSNCVECPECKMSYYVNLHDTCPYCKCKHPTRIIAVSTCEANELWNYTKEIASNKQYIELPNYLFGIFDYQKLNHTPVIIKIDKNKIKIDFSNISKLEIYTKLEGHDKDFKKQLIQTKQIDMASLENGLSILIKDKKDIVVNIGITK